MSRTNHVYEQFVERWAARYLEIRDKHGPEVAQAWADAFLNPEDIPRIQKAIENLHVEG